MRESTPYKDEGGIALCSVVTLSLSLALSLSFNIKCIMASNHLLDIFVGSRAKMAARWIKIESHPYQTPPLTFVDIYCSQDGGLATSK